MPKISMRTENQRRKVSKFRKSKYVVLRVDAEDAQDAKLSNECDMKSFTQYPSH